MDPEYIDTQNFILQKGYLLSQRYSVIEKIKLSYRNMSGVIVKALDVQKDEHVILKIFHDRYLSVGLQELDLLLQLQNVDATARIMYPLDHFILGRHLCLVFKMMDPAPLTKALATSVTKGMPESKHICEEKMLKVLRKGALFILQGLGFLQQNHVIHADLKPENILLDASRKPSSLRIIDFGNAICYNIPSHIEGYFDKFEVQSLIYRAPEVVFGVRFGPEIDVWSLGCILAEIYIGKPLFTGHNCSDLIKSMVNVLGPVPKDCFRCGKFYAEYMAFTSEERSLLNGTDWLMKYFLKQTGGTPDPHFISFLNGLLTYDPADRLKPCEAAVHPFIAPFINLRYFSPVAVFGWPKQFGKVPQQQSSFCLKQSTKSHEEDGQQDIQNGLKTSCLIEIETVAPETPQSEFSDAINSQTSILKKCTNIGSCDSLTQNLKFSSVKSSPSTKTNSPDPSVKVGQTSTDNRPGSTAHYTLDMNESCLKVESESPLSDCKQYTSVSSGQSKCDFSSVDSVNCISFADANKVGEGGSVQGVCKVERALEQETVMSAAAVTMDTSVETGMNLLHSRLSVSCSDAESVEICFDGDDDILFVSEVMHLNTPSKGNKIKPCTFNDSLCQQVIIPYEVAGHSQLNHTVSQGSCDSFKNIISSSTLLSASNKELDIANKSDAGEKLCSSYQSCSPPSDSKRKFSCSGCASASITNTHMIAGNRTVKGMEETRSDSAEDVPQKTASRRGLRNIPKKGDVPPCAAGPTSKLRCLRTARRYKHTISERLQYAYQLSSSKPPQTSKTKKQKLCPMLRKLGGATLRKDFAVGCKWSKPGAKDLLTAGKANTVQKSCSQVCQPVKRPAKRKRKCTEKPLSTKGKAVKRHKVVEPIKQSKSEQKLRQNSGGSHDCSPGVQKVAHFSERSSITCSKTDECKRTLGAEIKNIADGNIQHDVSLWNLAGCDMRETAEDQQQDGDSRVTSLSTYNCCRLHLEQQVIEVVQGSAVHLPAVDPNNSHIEEDDDEVRLLDW